LLRRAAQRRNNTTPEGKFPATQAAACELRRNVKVLAPAAFTITALAIVLSRF
jgi:hypothetical protein